ncbi:hypothetical protein YYG_01810 [Plasmodium vinckei petteri]|uniref:W2 domain-containing protein n=1 Tax=Plasmodium vinckei petteri TaxID=138298 RepID=W7ALX5_PLAVN|nr:hypothetical protein YYG_01810 [Plasmodium vinckei petteri]
MAKKKKQIHLNIIDFQKYYQKDDLIIQPTPAVENTIEEKKKKIFDKNEFVQNIEWRTTESTDKKINNRVNDDNNKFKNNQNDKNNLKKGDSTIILGSRGKNKLNEMKEEDVDFASLRSKKKEDDVDFANLRNKKKDDDADFGNLRNKKKEDDVDFANLRNKKKEKEEDVDFGNLRNKKKDDDTDFANLRNKRKEDDADFANLRNKKKEDDVDFANLRNKKKDDDTDFANLRNKKKDDDADFANLRNKKNDTETKTEKPYHLRKLEELRKQKQLKRQETEMSQNEKLEEKVKADKKEEEAKADKKEEVKVDKKEEEVKVDKKEEEEEVKVDKKEEEVKVDKKEEEVKEDKKEEVKADDTIKSTEEAKPKEGTKLKDSDVKPAVVAEKNEIDGNNETKVEEGAKKKFVPKRVIMYQEELKKKEEELKKKEEERKKKLEEQKKQRELTKLKSQTSDGSNVFIPSAKLLHLESLKEEKKETKIEIKRDSKSVITPPISKKDTTILNKQKSTEKNVKNIFLEIAEKTENAKIVEKMDIEEIAKKKREELYKKQLEKITKINEENTKYNNIYKHDIDNIKSFYNQIKDKILQNYLFTEDDAANICASLKTDECNYLESHVPFYVTISVFILSLPQKLEDDMYIKRASHLKNLLFYLKQNSKIENQDDYILNDIIKLCDELKYPHLSEETTLLEAVFDCLLFCGIISKDAFIKWFTDDNLDSELKSRAMLQLIYWNNWLKDEVNDDVEYVEDEPEEQVEEKVVEEDDIEKNVPKNFIFRKIKKKFL